MDGPSALDSESEGPVLGQDCGPSDPSFALAEDHGRLLCREELAQRRCEAPWDVSGSVWSFERSYENILKDLHSDGCAELEGAVHLDCSEFPCLTFLDAEVVSAESTCEFTRWFTTLGHEPPVRSFGGREWVYTMMLDGAENKPVVGMLLHARWDARLARIDRSYGGVTSDGAVAVTPQDCEGRSGVLQASGEDAFCEALLDYWGCPKENDHASEAYEDLVDDAEVLLDAYLDPDCSTMTREDVVLDCSVAPCSAIFVADGREFCGFVADSVMMLRRTEEFGTMSVMPLYPLDLVERRPLEEAFQDTLDLRFDRARRLLELQLKTHTSDDQ